MLVVISDLHLTDGTSGETISADAFRVFYDDLKMLIKNACFQKTEKGKSFIPVDRCDIVLNGDVLDVIRSKQWRDSEDLKPWSDPESDGFIKAVSEITEKILAFNDDALGYLRQMSTGVEIEDDQGKEHLVSVNLHYMVGNHDWFYHLPDSRLNATRNLVIEKMGLSNRADIIFPHLVDELHESELEQLCLQHRVYIQHGDIQDPINFVKAKGRNYSSLGDAIVVLLLNAFPEVVKEKLSLKDDDPLVLKLKEFDNVRPLYESPAWLRSVLKQHANSEQVDKIVNIWRENIRTMVAVPFVKAARRRLSFAERVKFFIQFELSKYIPLNTFVAIASFLGGLLPQHEKAYLEAAENEPWLYQQNGEAAKADYVTYGHTHLELLYPIDEVREGGKTRDKVYLNSGTWRLVHRRTQKNKKQFEYNRHHVMTYLAFYKGNERGGRPFESWSGRLGLD